MTRLKTKVRRVVDERRSNSIGNLVLTLYLLKDAKSMGTFKKQRVSINNTTGVELLFDHLLSELRIDIETVRGYDRKP